ncbi:hypothetical protein GAYE_SCF00G1677 [Galdieria yellowstonensis]|uniref:Matrin-type domain-containing protein n=1 Tax=Galdieria yellowstonensis TaxID=3028027 RepID=A0AAV9I950_9RHOD|nr:hypothetical protein GAYE_SCF00G1677 [Galdieria yellowstonensis]
MASSLLELTRTYHEDVERAVKLAVKLLKEKPKSYLPKLETEQRVRNLVNFIQDRQQKLLQLYEDEDGSRAAEIEQLQQPERLSLFYERLREIKESYRKSGNRGNEADNSSVQTAKKQEEELLALTEPKLVFSGEENYGKYLDLSSFYEAFVNIKGAPEMDYIDYLSTFYKFELFGNTLKNKRAYQNYLSSLLNYLEDFSRKLRPLRDEEAEKRNLEAQFEERWKNEVPEPTIQLDKFSSAEELEANVSPEEMKKMLMSMGLKCGGTPSERAKRLFETKDKDLSSLPPSMFAKKYPRTSGDGQTTSLDSSNRKEVARMEMLIRYLCEEVLADEVANTKTYVEKKLSQSYTEIEAERISEEQALQNPEEESEEEGEEEEKPIYNPKNIPLGWDGKPIPYWLYKLYGLNLEYTCEICGNETYRGPRTFERHFTEAKHIQGLRFLGIQYSRHFYMVTGIEDALRLDAKLKSQMELERFRPEEEEFEDAQGNVFSRRTYEDLRRQGLI